MIGVFYIRLALTHRAALEGCFFAPPAPITEQPISRIEELLLWNLVPSLKTQSSRAA
jgi:hypothetical protein